MVKDKEILIAMKERSGKIKVKVCKKEVNRWAPSKYEKMIDSKDYNQLAYLFFDLNSMGYNIQKAYHKFKSLASEPDLFFLK